MRLSRLLLLGAVAYGINSFLKTRRGTELKNDLMHKMGDWKKEVENIVTKARNRNTSPVETPVENNLGSMY